MLKKKSLWKDCNLHTWPKVFLGVVISSIARRVLKKRLGEEMNF